MNRTYDESTPWEIREQILRYEAARTMSDAERAAFFGLPKGCRMREGAKIIFPERLVIGEYCWIGENAILDASGGLEIGAHTSIGLGVFLWTHDSFKLNLRGENDREHRERIVRRPTRIGSRCFIGGPSVVMPGVSIGDKCVISPMSVVYEDLPSRTIYQPYRDLPGLAARVATLEERMKALPNLSSP